MDLLSSIFLAISIALGTYLYVSKKKEETIPSLNDEKNVEKEIIRRREVIASVEKFLNEAKFISPIATWKDKPIYRYIFNEGYLYEFEEIMSPRESNIQRSEEFLCFEQLCYKRVTNPIEFIEKFSNDIIESENEE